MSKRYIAIAAATLLGGLLLFGMSLGQRITVTAQTPSNYGPGIMTSMLVPCGSIVARAHSVLPTGWQNSASSCSQRLAHQRDYALAYGVVVLASGAVLFASVRGQRVHRPADADPDGLSLAGRQHS